MYGSLKGFLLKANKASFLLKRKKIPKIVIQIKQAKYCSSVSKLLLSYFAVGIIWYTVFIIMTEEK